MEAHGDGAAPRNVEANECLAEYLDEQDFAYIPLTGFYKGVDQGASFLVLEIDANDALDLSRRLRQESFLSPGGGSFTPLALSTRAWAALSLASLRRTDWPSAALRTGWFFG